MAEKKMTLKQFAKEYPEVVSALQDLVALLGEEAAQIEIDKMLNNRPLTFK